MDYSQSFSVLDYLSLPLKAEEQERGDMEQVNNPKKNHTR